MSDLNNMKRHFVVAPGTETQFIIYNSKYLVNFKYYITGVEHSPVSRSRDFIFSKQVPKSNKSSLTLIIGPDSGPSHQVFNKFFFGS